MKDVVRLDLPWYRHAAQLANVHDNHIHYKEFLDRYKLDGENGWSMWLRRVAVRLRKAFSNHCRTEEEARELFQADASGFVHYGRVVEVIRMVVPGLQDRQVVYCTLRCTVGLITPFTSCRGGAA